MSGVVATSRAGRASSPSARRDRSRCVVLMLAPATVLLVGLTIVPFAVSVVFSFTDYALTSPNTLTFTGLANYVRLFTSDEFQNAVRVTVEFTLAAVVLELVLGVGIAALLHHETRGVTALRLVYLMPLAITPVAAE